LSKRAYIFPASFEYLDQTIGGKTVVVLLGFCHCCTPGRSYRA